MAVNSSERIMKLHRGRHNKSFSVHKCCPFLAFHSFFTHITFLSFWPLSIISILNTLSMFYSHYNAKPNIKKPLGPTQTFFLKSQMETRAIFQ